MAGGITTGQLSETIDLGGGGTQISKNQAAHGFNLYEPIYHNGSTWELAQANDGATLAEYLVTEVEDVDNFVATKFGEVEAIGHGFTVGEHYFLSDTTAGGVVTTEPNTYSCPIFYVEDANTLHVEIYRPSVPSPTATPVTWEKKVLASTVSNVVAQPAELYFNDLVIGKDYRLTIYVSSNYESSVVRGKGRISYSDGTKTILDQLDDRSDSTGQFEFSNHTASTVFRADTTTLIPTVDATRQSGGNSRVNAGSYAILEEMPTKQVFIDVPGVTKWQRKQLAATNNVSELNWSNLEIGKTYRLTLATRHLGANTSSHVQANHDGNVILETRHQLLLINPPDDTLARTTIFTATANTVTFTKSGGGTISSGRGTYSILEELPTHIETTQWS